MILQLELIACFKQISSFSCVKGVAYGLMQNRTLDLLQKQSPNIIFHHESLKKYHRSECQEI